MANNNNNNNNKTGGSYGFINKIELNPQVHSISNMANSNSIIKKTEYWLPEELWREVKDYMGLCKKEDNVHWEFISKAKLKDVLQLNLPHYRIQYEGSHRPRIEINSEGTVTLKKHNGDVWSEFNLTPQQFYFKSLKGIYMNRGKMTPKRWKKLSDIMTKKLCQWERCKEGDKFKYSCDRKIHHNKHNTQFNITKNKTVLTITKKLKTVCELKFTDNNGRTWINLKLKKAEFNYKGILNAAIKQ